MASRLIKTGGDANLLLLVVHHLGVDGISWGVLLEDIETACRQIIAGEPVLANVPVVNAASPFPRDVEILRQFAEALVVDATAIQVLEAGAAVCLWSVAERRSHV